MQRSCKREGFEHAAPGLRMMGNFSRHLEISTRGTDHGHYTRVPYLALRIKSILAQGVLTTLAMRFLEPRSLSTGPLLGVAVIAVGIFIVEAVGGPSQPRNGLHGEASMQMQQRTLDTLTTHRSPEPPKVVDHELWQAAFHPKGNETNEARIALGRRLYFETRLSADGTVSCATCHDVLRSFTDLRPSSEGIGGQLGKRNAPTTMNAALLGNQFWDGRASTVDDQALQPILNPVEMGMPNEEAAVAAIAQDPTYQEMFRVAYDRGVNFPDIGRAIGAFERTLIFLNSPADQFLAGDPNAISRSAERGWILFNSKARCTSCHPLNSSSPLGTDNRFHNVGVSARQQDFEALAQRALIELKSDPSQRNLEVLAVKTDLSALGRFMISKNVSDIGAFRTPQIRNTGITAPYMHDGSQPTLWDVIDHYNKGGEANPYLDGGMEPLGLTEPEIDDLVEFLFTLTDVQFAEQNQAELERQRSMAASKRPFRNDKLAHKRTFAFDPRPLQDGN